MDRFSKSFTHKGQSIKLDVARTPGGQMQMDVSGGKSRLSYTGSPDGAKRLAQRLLGGGKKPDANKR